MDEALAVIAENFGKYKPDEIAPFTSLVDERLTIVNQPDLAVSSTEGLPITSVAVEMTGSIPRSARRFATSFPP